ncbi:MAG TPA: toxin HipA [Bacteroidetes bacterium]|nr:toxin HipA [Bacteroidota bacterium]
MRKAKVFVNGGEAGFFCELESNKKFEFEYREEYTGLPISLTMPVKGRKFLFETFPPFFDGLLPEGIQLEALLRQKKIDRNDYFGQLMAVGGDMVGAVTVEEIV